MSSVITADFSSPDNSRAAQCFGAAYRLAIARGYCARIARSLAKPARARGLICWWQTPDEIAAGVIPQMQQSATCAKEPA